MEKLLLKMRQCILVLVVVFALVNQINAYASELEVMQEEVIQESEVVEILFEETTQGLNELEIMVGELMQEDSNLNVKEVNFLYEGDEGYLINSGIHYIADVDENGVAQWATMEPDEWGSYYMMDMAKIAHIFYDDVIILIDFEEYNNLWATIIVNLERDEFRILQLSEEESFYDLTAFRGDTRYYNRQDLSFSYDKGYYFYNEYYFEWLVGFDENGVALFKTAEKEVEPLIFYGDNTISFDFKRINYIGVWKEGSRENWEERKGGLLNPTTHAFGHTLEGEGSHYDLNKIFNEPKEIPTVIEKPKTATENFVVNIYEKLLGRPYDQAGLAYWSGHLSNKKISAADIIVQFVNSAEFKTKNVQNTVFVDSLYQALFNRNATPQEQQRWVGALTTGVSQTGVISHLIASEEFQQVAKNAGIIAGSITVTNAPDVNLELTKYVERCYATVLGRKADQGGLNYWTGLVLNGILTPEQVAERIVFSVESRGHNVSNQDFVKMLYATYMGRTEDAVGFNYWAKLLSSGTSREAVASAFGRSTEFKLIVKSFGL
jgi:Phycobilisome Linker polypeptide.